MNEDLDRAGPETVAVRLWIIGRVSDGARDQVLEVANVLPSEVFQPETVLQLNDYLVTMFACFRNLATFLLEKRRLQPAQTVNELRDERVLARAHSRVNSLLEYRQPRNQGVGECGRVS